MNSTDNSPAGTKQGFFYGWYVVAASWIMLFLVYSVAVSIFFKPILDEFGWDRATLSSVQTVAMLVFAVVSPFMGRLIDRFGPRAMLFVCVATQTLSSLITGLATSLWHLYISRFLFEIRVLHNTQVLINRWFVRKRGLSASFRYHIYLKGLNWFLHYQDPYELVLSGNCLSDNVYIVVSDLDPGACMGPFPFLIFISSVWVILPF